MRWTKPRGRVTKIAAIAVVPAERGDEPWNAGAAGARQELHPINDAETLVILIQLEQQELLMEMAPAIYFETDHYRGWPAVPVRLGAIHGTGAAAGRRRAASRAEVAGVELAANRLIEGDAGLRDPSRGPEAPRQEFRW